MTSSIGDLTPELTGIVQRTPDHYTFKLGGGSGSQILMASDGLFDLTTSQEIFLEHFDDAQSIMDYVESTTKDGFHDNTTVLHVRMT